jgi:hypothetical protein
MPTPKEKATVGLWLIRDAILELLGDRKKQNLPGMRAVPIKNALGLFGYGPKSQKPGIAEKFLKMMEGDGDIEGKGKPRLYSAKP